MVEKYYTPSIEEFHVGFEYEECIKNGYFSDYDGSFKKRIFSNGDLKNFTTEFRTIQYDLDGGGLQVRAKMLNSSDLKDLGWVIEIEDENMIKAMIDIPYEYEGATLHGKWEISFGKDRYCFIYEDLWGKTGFFRGVIKNKSELKNIMKMINIF